MTKKKTKRTPGRCEQFLETATKQLRQCAVPTVLAIIVSVLISKLGMPLVALALVVGGGYAWWRGYRVKIVKPDAPLPNNDAE
jgi:hypothetical protein